MTAFPPDYFAARDRFRAAVARLGWACEAHPIAARGPAGEELTLDVAVSPGLGPALVTSSGVHGVEGPFGSAVQLALLDRWATTGPPPPRVVLLHAVSPFGYAWRRRFDESSADPNRNFLKPGEAYAGSPPGYAALDGLLNPPSPPSRWEPFRLKAAWAVLRHGMPALRQAVASGQYDFPRGLIFGGSAPSESHRVIAAHLPRWLGGARRVVHLDFHTGLGAWGRWKLLIDAPLSAAQRGWLAERYGADGFEDEGPAGMSYRARGGFGEWCATGGFAADYLFACAEFGTFGPIRMLAGVRAENRAWHHGDRADRWRAELGELFCPADPAWRAAVLAGGLDVVDRAVCGSL